MDDLKDLRRIGEVIRLIDDLQKKCDKSGDWSELNIALNPDSWIYKNSLVIGLTYVRVSSISKTHTPNWNKALDRTRELCVSSGEDENEMLTGLIDEK